MARAEMPRRLPQQRVDSRAVAGVITFEVLTVQLAIETARGLHELEASLESREHSST